MEGPQMTLEELLMICIMLATLVLLAGVLALSILDYSRKVREKVREANEALPQRMTDEGRG